MQSKIRKLSGLIANWYRYLYWSFLCFAFHKKISWSQSEFILFYIRLSPVFGFIFNTRDLRRNLRIWWRIRTTFDDVICTYIYPFPQVKIYWVLRGHIFISHITAPNYFFKTSSCLWNSLARSFQKANKKLGLFKSALYFILYLRISP